jgi:acetyl esterase/lipase
MKRIKKLWWVLPALLILASVVFILWASTAATPMPEALAALESDAQVHVETDPWLVFRPVDQDPTAGLIFYPGGRVDPRAYAPTARALAEEGYLVVIVPMPLNLAFFAPGRAAEVMAAFPGVENWAVGGHSLGGAMAANFAHDNPEAVRPGLVGIVCSSQRRPDRTRSGCDFHLRHARWTGDGGRDSSLALLVAAGYTVDRH